MPTLYRNPNRYDSISDYLFALSFTVNKDYFVCGAIQFPIAEIIGHTVATFAAKMRAHGWVPVEILEPPVKWPLV